MKSLVILTSAFLMASPVVGLAQGSAGKPVAAPTEKTKVVALPAPDFKVTDANGKAQTLSQYAGSWVVLEWTNPGCPFVQKQYSSGNMQKLQKIYTEKKVVWLTVNSTAKGKKDYLDAAGLLANAKKEGAVPTAILIDEDGKMGKAYGATATPHMYVINPQQKIVYSGAIDDGQGTDVKELTNAKNYVAPVLDNALANNDITPTHTRAVGCSIKYK